ncbi:hypothetical protein [Chryseobacterium luteum]|uniref:Uncharacterized protein n=1 Tax=Chryseobacterium luteum TaxID=421531 RepID=A0A085ZXP3_9FLAO|nr:hypothetical protein [Chryseobacterium luteum]KFF09207.1 hypothetical protein IX38_01460 [Chryseobacterium luteum]
MEKFFLKKDELLDICKSSENEELSSKAVLLENILNEDVVGGTGIIGYAQSYSQSYTEHYGQSYSRQIDVTLTQL